MAGDWMKVEHATPDKPEVWGIAAALEISPDEAFGICFRMWRWFDQHSRDGNAQSVTAALLDRHLGVPGFANAALAVGWLAACELDGRPSLRLPNFERHNGETAKQRALTSKRVAKHKSKGNANGNATGVTSALPREEKRREKKRVIQEPPKPPAESAAAMPEVPAEVAEIWEQWLRYKTERKETYKPEGLRGAVTHLRNRVAEIGPNEVKRKILRAIASTWKGWDDDRHLSASSPSRSANSEQRKPITGISHLEGVR